MHRWTMAETKFHAIFLFPWHKTYCHTKLLLTKLTDTSTLPLTFILANADILEKKKKKGSDWKDPFKLRVWGLFLQLSWARNCGSVIECLSSFHKVLGSIPALEKQSQRQLSLQEALLWSSAHCSPRRTRQNSGACGGSASSSGLPKAPDDTRSLSQFCFPCAERHCRQGSLPAHIPTMSLEAMISS